MSNDLFSFNFIPPKTNCGNRYGSEWERNMICNLHKTGRISVSGPFLDEFCGDWRESKETILAICVNPETQRIYLAIYNETHPRHSLSKLIKVTKANGTLANRGLFTIVWGKWKVEKWKEIMGKYIKGTYNIVITEISGELIAVIDLSLPRHSQGGTHDNDFPKT